jgi:hypothetical protein
MPYMVIIFLLCISIIVKLKKTYMTYMFIIFNI